MRRAARSALIVSALALAACASRPDHWYRAASTPDQANSDEHYCRTEATQVARARSRVDANILNDRNVGHDFGSASLYRSDLNINRGEQLAAEERVNIRELIRACMADQGYRLVRDD
ncbi:MAG: hypothetical protein HY060_10280 [Proteobacteria bacterium]|nr:hypothetical protein [Pseudomonadota bacterium]